MRLNVLRMRESTSHPELYKTVPERQRDLFNAAMRGNVQEIHSLFKRHGDGLKASYVLPYRGSTALHEALAAKKFRAALVLISRGAGLHHDSAKLGTPLAIAAGMGHQGLVRMLVEKGADVNHDVPHSGVTALAEAIEGGHLPVVKYLLKKKARLELGVNRFMVDEPHEFAGELAASTKNLALQKKYAAIQAYLLRLPQQ